MISRRHSDIVWYLSQVQASLKHMQPDRAEIVIQIHLTSSTDNEMASAPSWNQTLTPPYPSSGTGVEATTIFDGEEAHLLTKPEDRDIRKVRFQLASDSTSELSDSTSEFDCDDLDITITDDKEALPLSQFVGQTPVETTVPDSPEREKLLSDPLVGDIIPPYSQTNSLPERVLTFSSGKPSVDTMIRSHVVDAQAKILVVAAVAGGLRSQISTFVARLNRERIIPLLTGRDGPETGHQSLELWCEDNGD